MTAKSPSWIQDRFVLSAILDCCLDISCRNLSVSRQNQTNSWVGGGVEGRGAHDLRIRQHTRVNFQAPIRGRRSTRLHAIVRLSPEEDLAPAYHMYENRFSTWKTAIYLSLAEVIRLIVSTEILRDAGTVLDDARRAHVLVAVTPLQLSNQKPPHQQKYAAALGTDCYTRPLKNTNPSHQTK